MTFRYKPALAFFLTYLASPTTSFATPLASKDVKMVNQHDQFIEEGLRLINTNPRAALGKYLDAISMWPTIDSLETARKLLEATSSWDKEYALAVDVLRRESLLVPNNAPEDDLKEKDQIVDLCLKMKSLAEPNVGFVLVKATRIPPGFSFKIAGSPELSPAILDSDYPVLPGPITIDASALGAEPFRTVIDVSRGEKKQVFITLKFVESAPVVPVAVDPNAGSALRTTGLVVAGVGVAAAVVGAIFGSAAKGAGDELNGKVKPGVVYDSSLQGIDDRGRTDQKLEWVFLGVGGAAVVGGAICYLVGLAQRGSEPSGPPRSASARPSPSLSLQPLISPRDLGAAVGGTF